MRRKSTLILVLILGLVLAACSSDPTTSEEYLDLEQELTVAEGQIEDLETQLAAVTAERDDLLADPDVPIEVLAVTDEWLAANERRDGSVEDLYAIGGYHLYGDEKIPRDQLASHFGGAGGGKHEWITDPYVIADEGDGRYVVVRGMRLDLATGFYASALTFEIKEAADGTPQIVHTQWMYVH